MLQLNQSNAIKWSMMDRHISRRFRCSWYCVQLVLGWELE